MSLRCPNKVGGHGAPCRLEMAHVGGCLPPIRRRGYMAAAVLVALVLAGCNSNPERRFCDDASDWHAQQALYEQDPAVSAWHDGKADAYNDAAYTLDIDCRDWMAYRDPPADLGGAA